MTIIVGSWAALALATAVFGLVDDREEGKIATRTIVLFVILIAVISMTVHLSLPQVNVSGSSKIAELMALNVMMR